MNLDDSSCANHTVRPYSLYDVLRDNLIEYCINKLLCRHHFSHKKNDAVNNNSLSTFMPTNLANL